MGIRKNDKHQLLTQTCTNPTTSWLVHSLNAFGARTNHGQAWTHKTHHGPDLGEATTFPLIKYSMPGHGTGTQMSFYPRTPKWESQTRNSRSWVFCNLWAHNFMCRPLIEMRSTAKLYPLPRAFQRYVAQHLHTKKSGRFATFSGRESNCQIDY
jgi:hypothetical protein